MFLHLKKYLEFKKTTFQFRTSGWKVRTKRQKSIWRGNDWFANACNPENFIVSHTTDTSCIRQPFYLTVTPLGGGPSHSYYYNYDVRFGPVCVQLNYFDPIHS